MTNIDLNPYVHEPLRTQDQLRLVLEDLLEAANLRQLWFIFLDDEARLTGPFMPGDGFPSDPLESVDTDDLGTVTAAQLLGARVRMITETIEAASLVLVWECPGRDALSPETRAWAREMAHACRDAHVSLRAQFLLHDQGLRMLVPDDYV